jgi:hypothetical protein
MMSGPNALLALNVAPITFSANTSRRLPVRFSPEAQEDIEDLLNSTREQWAARQRTIYRYALIRAFAT